jgi:hypothetical protein
MWLTFLAVKVDLKSASLATTLVLLLVFLAEYI